MIPAVELNRQQSVNKLNLQLYLIGLTANPRRDAATNPVFIILIDILAISLKFYNFFKFFSDGKKEV